MLLDRIDQQVKINGVRIEIREIEKCILSLDEVKRVIVRVKMDENKNKYLCAYIILENKEFENVKEIIKSKISKYLPASMLPRKYIIIKEFPLNRNGKIDYRQLDRLEEELV